MVAGVITPIALGEFDFRELRFSGPCGLNGCLDLILFPFCAGRPQRRRHVDNNDF